MSLPKLLLISLGGTIAMTRDSTGGITPTLAAADLVGAVAGIEKVAQIECASPLKVPGASLTIEDVVALAALIDARLEGDVAGVVVIQGTDTIEETAFLLDLIVRSRKPVVVTGAMRGPQTPGADGPANLLAAAIVAAAPEAEGLGTLVVLNDQIHAARQVQKSHTALPSAFASPGAGPLGLVVEGRPILHCRPAGRSGSLPVLSRVAAPVALMKMSLGDDGRMLKELPRLGYEGVVVEGMGAGHVPAIVAPIVGALVEAMPVVLATRVPAGPIFMSTYGFAGSEMDLLRRGALSAGNLSGLKARLLLALLVPMHADRSALSSAFGELAMAGVR